MVADQSGNQSIKRAVIAKLTFELCLGYNKLTFLGCRLFLVDHIIRFGSWKQCDFPSLKHKRVCVMFAVMNHLSIICHGLPRMR